MYPLVNRTDRVVPQGRAFQPQAMGQCLEDDIQLWRWSERLKFQRSGLPSTGEVIAPQRSCARGCHSRPLGTVSDCKRKGLSSDRSKRLSCKAQSYKDESGNDESGNFPFSAFMIHTF